MPGSALDHERVWRIADAGRDRLVHGSTRFELHGASMRIDDDAAVLDREGGFVVGWDMVNIVEFGRAVERTW